MDFITVTDWARIGLAVFDVAAAFILIRAANKYRANAAVVVQALWATFTAFAAILAAIPPLHRLGIIDLPTEAAMPIITVAILIMSIPSLVWLLTYYGNGFE